MLHSTLLVETSPNMLNFAKLTTTHYLKNDCEMNVVIFCPPIILKMNFFYLSSQTLTVLKFLSAPYFSVKIRIRLIAHCSVTSSEKTSKQEAAVSSRNIVKIIVLELVEISVCLMSPIITTKVFITETLLSLFVMYVASVCR